MPSGPQHSGVAVLAYNALASWQKEPWKGKEDELSRFSILPDDLFASDYADYCILPDGNAIPHGPTDRFAMVPFSSGYDRSLTRDVFSYYTGRMVAALSSGNIRESIAFGGILAHYIADGCHPAHLWNNLSIYSLLPPPAGKYWQMHRSLDSVSVRADLCRGISPRLLGLDIRETVFNTVDEYERMVQWGKTRLVPAVNALYAEDQGGAEIHINTCYKKAAGLLSSLWNTAFCIASGRFEDNEIESLKEVKLNRTVPVNAFTVDPYFFYPLMDYDCDGKGNLVPLTIKAGVQGGGRMMEFADGIAMTFGYVMYEIPANLFTKIRVKAGVSPLTAREGEAVFRIIDAKTPPVYRDAHNTLVDCGGDILYESGIMTGKDAYTDIEVNPGDAELITLFVECPGKNKNIHAIWAEPVLVK